MGTPINKQVKATVALAEKRRAALRSHSKIEGAFFAGFLRGRLIVVQKAPPKESRMEFRLCIKHEDCDVAFMTEFLYKKPSESSSTPGLARIHPLSVKVWTKEFKKFSEWWREADKLMEYYLESTSGVEREMHVLRTVDFFHRSKSKVKRKIGRILLPRSSPAPSEECD